MDTKVCRIGSTVIFSAFLIPQSLGAKTGQKRRVPFALFSLLLSAGKCTPPSFPTTDPFIFFFLRVNQKNSPPLEKRGVQPFTCGWRRVKNEKDFFFPSRKEHRTQ